VLSFTPQLQIPVLTSHVELRLTSAHAGALVTCDGWQFASVEQGGLEGVRIAFDPDDTFGWGSRSGWHGGGTKPKSAANIAP
jgi:hypothetical protein